MRRSAKETPPVPDIYQVAVNRGRACWRYWDGETWHKSRRTPDLTKHDPAPLPKREWMDWFDNAEQPVEAAEEQKPESLDLTVTAKDMTTNLRNLADVMEAADSHISEMARILKPLGWTVEMKLRQIDT